MATHTKQETVDDGSRSKCIYIYKHKIYRKERKLRGVVKGQRVPIAMLVLLENKSQILWLLLESLERLPFQSLIFGVSLHLRLSPIDVLQPRTHVLKDSGSPTSYHLDDAKQIIVWCWLT